MRKVDMKTETGPVKCKTQRERQTWTRGKRKTDRICFLVWLLALHHSNRFKYLRDKSAETIAPAATPRP